VPVIEIPIVTVEPYYKAFMPAIKFRIQLGEARSSAKSAERIIGGFLNVDVSILKDKGSWDTVWLGRFTLPIAASSERPLNQYTTEQIFALSIDINNSMFDFIKTLNGDDIVFLLTFSGFALWYKTDNTQVVYSTNEPFGTGETSREAALSVDKWKKLISAYYRDLTWLPVSRETYAKIAAILNDEGITPDEFVDRAIKDRKK